MSLKDTIESDITKVFLNTDEFADEAVWTPAGGIPQTPVPGLYNNFPLHGDENQEQDVEQPRTFFVTSSALVSNWRARDFVRIKNTTYQIINAPYSKEDGSGWSVVPLRLPRGQETLI